MKNMRCLYCDMKINKYSLYDLFVEEDKLCFKCRKQMPINRRRFNVDSLKCESFYDYDTLFKTLLLQYKECYDEALKDVFLYKIDIYLKIKYFDYRVVYVPSTKKKFEKRGFDHLKLIFNSLDLKEAGSLLIKEDLVQEGKNLKEREKMKNNYCFEGKYHKKILIIDDVCTTGSSLIGAYNALKGYCDDIKAIVLAKA